MMQFHILRNGQKSGPFSREEVRSRLAAGTLQPTDLTWHEGATDWLPLSSIQDLVGIVPPPMPSLPPTKTSGLAVASLVLGIFGFLLGWLTSIPAVICGHISLSRIKKSAGALTGRGMAIAGLVIGYLGVVLCVLAIFAAFAIPAAMSVLDKSKSMRAMSNAKQIYLACAAYGSDHNGNFPPNLELLVPKYLPDSTLLASPMLGDPTSVGFDYFGGIISGNPDKILLQSKALSKRRERVTVTVGGAARLQRE